MPAPTRQDLYLHGLPAAALAAPRLAVQSVDVGANVLTIPGHGLAAGARVRPSNLGGTLITGLSASTLYYVRSDVTEDLLSLSATEGGAAVDLTDEGVGAHFLTEQIEGRLDELLADTTEEIIAELTAHRDVDPANLPRHIVMLICRVAARARVSTQGLTNAFYKDAVAALMARQAEDDATRKRYRAGAPVLGLTDGTPDTADNGSVFEGDDDPPEVFA